jgi:two-component system response regulator (stage 0 sporulation protein F)
VREPTILIVEDEPAIRRLVKETLEPRYLVQEAVDGLDGLQRVQSVKPDLIILDIRMPGLDGLSVLRKLKADRQTAGIPVIILSVHGETDILLEGQRAGASDHLIKPFDLHELRRVVSRQLPLAD